MMKRTVVIIINEQHTMLPDQIKQIETLYPNTDFQLEYVKVPTKGWTFEEMEKVRDEIWNRGYFAVIFVSPIPVLLKELSYYEGHDTAKGRKNVPHIFVFHNDKREKKELPDGRIVYTVAKEGWKLL